MCHARFSSLDGRAARGCRGAIEAIFAAIVRALEFAVKRHREHRCNSGGADVPATAADPFIPTEICV
jgi:hypothetical protein